MSWSLYRWTWRLESPLHVGTTPAGSLNRCRLYVPARVLWGAVTAELARRSRDGGFPDYRKVGQELHKTCRFTYLFPAKRDGGQWRAWLPRYEEGAGLVWRREDRADSEQDLPDRQMRIRLLATQPGTAIDPSSDTAEEGSLRETECLNTHWRDGTGSPVLLAGYVFVRDGWPEDLRGIGDLAVGGDIRYGLGRLRRLAVWEAASDVFSGAVELDGPEPGVQSDCLGAHGFAGSDEDGEIICGQREQVVFWDYDDAGRRVLRRANRPLWAPGSKSTGGKVWWRIDESGHWRLEVRAPQERRKL